MRGKVPMESKHRYRDRITPAHAGKSVFHGFCAVEVQDHPRTCGEKDIDVISAAAQVGSPPHMRGKAYYRSKSRDWDGITPAHAGKRRQNGNCKNADWDHPRTCGEKRCRKEKIKNELGSPPHMRGKALSTRYQHDSWGITPAHAGKRD